MQACYKALRWNARFDALRQARGRRVLKLARKWLFLELITRVNFINKQGLYNERTK